jgi:hypothetical protein
VRYPIRKLVLFFALQALAVAVMIVISRREDCVWGRCSSPSPGALVLSILLILWELWIIARVLIDPGRVWKLLLGLGGLSFVAAFVCLFVAFKLMSGSGWMVLVWWHVVVGLLLSGAGLLAGISDLLERWRRPDHTLPEDQRSSGMWPFD